MPETDSAGVDLSEVGIPEEYDLKPAPAPLGPDVMGKVKRIELTRIAGVNDEPHQLAIVFRMDHGGVVDTDYGTLLPIPVVEGMLEIFLAYLKVGGDEVKSEPEA